MTYILDHIQDPLKSCSIFLKKQCKQTDFSKVFRTQRWLFPLLQHGISMLHRTGSQWSFFKKSVQKHSKRHVNLLQYFTPSKLYECFHNMNIVLKFFDCHSILFEKVAKTNIFGFQ